MRQFVPIILISLTFTSCDCVQQATGVVLDRQTKKPISNVSLGKYENEDAANSYSKRIYTDKDGLFDYHSTSGGIRKCPDLVLYFNKQGYKTSKVTLASVSTNDTVFLDKVPFNRDSSIHISLLEFDKLINNCINLLKENKLKDISDEQHIEIMMCLNTIFMRNFKGGHYDELRQLSEEKKYTTDIIKVYPKWIPNRGMGFYFPDLNMELHGTPMLYAIYNVQK
jgi:5-hydroxyisourate hydrolase-like protein (transthyretin family)